MTQSIETTATTNTSAALPADTVARLIELWRCVRFVQDELHELLDCEWYIPQEPLEKINELRIKLVHVAREIKAITGPFEL